MPTPRYIVNQRAQPAYFSLAAPARATLESALNALADLPEPEWPSAGATRLSSPNPLYLVRLDKSLRAFVQPTDGGQPELLDLVRRELLDRYFREPDKQATAE